MQIEVTEANLEEIKEKLFVHFKCNIYQSEYGFGFTNCDSDIYESEIEAAVAALEYYRD